MEDSQVTIVVVPRERFSYSERSLSSIYQNTTFPFRLIYVSAGSPMSIQRYLDRESKRRGFQLIYVKRYLSPNQARNLALREVYTKYVVFLDNDALVTRGWLESLVQCAEETGAWIVGPLYLIGEIEDQKIHMAAGNLHFKEHQGKRILYDEQCLFETPLGEVRGSLARKACDYVEFHCMLVRTDVFQRIGLLDEKLLSHNEHIDICLAVRDAGGSVYIEPKAMTSYVPPPPCEWSDLTYFMLRWSETWNLETVRHFNQKWGVSAARWFGDESSPDTEDTIVRWARGHRRLMTGLRVSGDVVGCRPESFLEQAEVMVAMFLSVDRDCFDLALTTGDGSIEKFQSALNPQASLEQLPHLLQEADEKNLNVMIHPLAHGRPGEPALVRLDDLDPEGLSRVKPYAFLTLETRPGRYQCLLAVAQGNWRSDATLRRLVAADQGNGKTNSFVRMAGSKNAEPESGQIAGGYPRVKLIEGVTGHLITVHQLEGSKAVPHLWSSQVS